MNILQEIFTDHYEEMLYTLHPRDSIIENVDKMILCGDPAFGGAMYGCCLLYTSPLYAFSKTAVGVMTGLTAQTEAAISHMGQFLLCHLYPRRNPGQYQVKDRSLRVHDAARQSHNRRTVLHIRCV